MNVSRIPCATVLMLCLALHASAYEKSYLPLSEKELSSRFLQRTVRERFVPFADVQESACIGSARVRFLHSDSIPVSGRDFDGKPWTSTAGAGMGGSLYSADLDHNGVADIIYASFTGGMVGRHRCTF